MSSYDNAYCSSIPIKSIMVTRRKLRSKRHKRRNNRNLRKSRKQKSILKYAKSCIKNFSNHELTDTDFIVLAKGMKFVPQRKFKNGKTMLMRSFNKLARNMRCKYELDDGGSYTPHPFHVSSKFKPQLASEAIEKYLFQTKLEISNMKIKSSKSNLTNNEWKALYDLKQNKNIIIKQADKTKTIVVQNKSNYIKEGERQLAQIYYEQIEYPLTKDIYKQVEEIITSLSTNQLIDETTKQYLNGNKNPTPGIIYFLPKLHKLSTEELNMTSSSKLLIPSRPIISQINSCTERIGRLADIFLLPLVQKQDTYLRDSKDFINHIEKTICPNNLILASYDITSMYTNMTVNELLSAVENALENVDEDIFPIPFIGTENILRILKLQLENNEFEFAGKFYKQKIGCSMGAVPSPEISDLRAYEVINNILSKFPYKNQIVAHFRFRDDGIIMFKGTTEELEKLFKIANEEHKLLKFTFIISDNEITFLDTTIYKGERFHHNKILDIKSYHKPTESYAYLQKGSCHYNKVFNGIVRGEIIRALRNNSNKLNRTNEIQQLKKRFLKRGYKSSEINKTITETNSTTRESTLKLTDKNKKSQIPSILVTKYHPCLRQLPKLMKKHFHLIENDEEAKKLFPRAPMVAFKRDKNLAQYISPTRTFIK